MTSTKPARSFVTDQQAMVHALFARHRPMSAVARLHGVTQIRVREALVLHERNLLRHAGIGPPLLKQMGAQQRGRLPAMSSPQSGETRTVMPTGSCLTGATPS